MVALVDVPRSHERNPMSALLSQAAVLTGRLLVRSVRNPMTVVHIQGSPVENRLYNMLQGNIDNHEKLIDLYKKELVET